MEGEEDGFGVRKAVDSLEFGAEVRLRVGLVVGF